MRLKDAKVATVAVAPSEDEEGKEDAAEEVPAPGDPAGPAEAGEEPGDLQE